MKFPTWFFKLRSQHKLNFFYSLLFIVINYSNFVNVCSISNVGNHICLTSNSSIIKNEKRNYWPKLILEISNTPSVNVVTIVDDLTLLREDNRL